MSIEIIEKALEANPKGVIIEIKDAEFVRLKKDSKYFQRFGPEVHFWDVTVQTTAGRVWFRTYSREQGEAFTLAHPGDKVSTKVLITKVGDKNPKFETRYLFGKLLTKAVADVKIEKMNDVKPEETSDAFPTGLVF